VTSLSFLASAVDLNSPGRYLHWSIFTVSVANLVLIGVMVVLFGAALLIRFPRPRDEDVTQAAPAVEYTSSGEKMWTARIRHTALRLLPHKARTLWPPVHARARARGAV